MILRVIPFAVVKFIAAVGGVAAIGRSNLVIQELDWFRCNGPVVHGECQNGDVAVEPKPYVRLRQGDTVFTAVHDCFREHKLFRNMLRFDVRSAEIPSALDCKTKLQTVLLGLVAGEQQKIHPFRPTEFRSGRNRVTMADVVPAAGIIDHGTLESPVLHCGKFARDGGLVRIPVEPPPPTVYAVFTRRIRKVIGDVLRLRRKRERHASRNRRDDRQFVYIVE